MLDLLQDSPSRTPDGEILLDMVNVLAAFEPEFIARRKRKPLEYRYVDLIDIPANHEPGVAVLVRSEWSINLE